MPQLADLGFMELLVIAAMGYVAYDCWDKGQKTTAFIAGGVAFYFLVIGMTNNDNSFNPVP